MSKLTIEIPDSLHRAVKSMASAQGETIKDFFIEAISEKLKKSAKLKPKKEIKTASKTKKNMKKTKAKNSKYITEKEADRMLKPYLMRMIQRIESGEEETYDWEDVKSELKKI